MGKLDDLIRLRQMALEFWALHAEDALDDRLYLTGDYTQMFRPEFRLRWIAEAERQGLTTQEMFSAIMLFRGIAG